jgi:hypothetical protein
MDAKTRRRQQKATTQATPDRIVMERRMIVAEVPVDAHGGNTHPFIALLQETAEALHQQWSGGKTSTDLEDGYADVPNSTGMESITDSLVADWNGTRLTIEFAPIDEA